MKKVVRLTDKQLKNIIAESVRTVLKEEKKNKKPTYRGVKGSVFIDHGDWSDPEIWYDGKTFNYWDVEDSLYSDYEEDCEEQGEKATSEGFDNMPTEWFAYKLKDYAYDRDENGMPLA